MLTTVIATLTISQLIMYASIRKLRKQVVTLDASSQQTTIVQQAIAASNLVTTERAIETAAKQEAIVSHLGLRFATEEDGSGGMVH